MLNFNSSRLLQTFTITFISLLCVLFNSLTFVNYHKFGFTKNNSQYIAKGIRGSLYDSKGFELYSVKSTYAFKYSSDERLFLNNLFLESHQNNSLFVKYQLFTKTAWINNQLQLIFMGKDTFLKVNNIDQKKIINIHGDNIFVDIKKNIVYGYEYIVATQWHNKLYSKGFKYDNKLQLLTLESKVKVIYEP